MRLRKKVDALERLVLEAVPREAHELVVKQLLQRIEDLTRQNNELFQKMIARNLPELQTFSADFPDYTLQSTYTPETDVDNAGEILDEISE